MSHIKEASIIWVKYNLNNQRSFPQRDDCKARNRNWGSNKKLIVAQSVPCLTADPGVASSIPARHHTFVEIDHEITSTAILLPSTD